MSGAEIVVEAAQIAAEATKYKLSGFSSLFEISFGVNLIASVWGEVHSAGKAAFSKHIDEFLHNSRAQDADYSPDTKHIVNNAAARLRTFRSKAELTGSRISQSGRWLGVTSAVILAVILYYCGLRPDCAVSYSWILTIIGTLVIPVPLIIFLLKYYWYNRTKRLKEKCDEYQGILGNKSKERDTLDELLSAIKLSQE